MIRSGRGLAVLVAADLDRYRRDDRRNPGASSETSGAELKIGGSKPRASPSPAAATAKPPTSPPA